MVVFSDEADAAFNSGQVGIATAAFGMEILLGTVEPGVWFPVELKEQRAAIFKRSKRGTVLWEV